MKILSSVWLKGCRLDDQELICAGSAIFGWHLGGNYKSEEILIEGW